MNNDKWDEERRRNADDLSSSRREDVGADMPGVGMGGASLAGAGRVYDDLHTRDEVHDELDLTSRLVHLDDVDEFKVADGDPDIRHGHAAARVAPLRADGDHANDNAGDDSKGTAITAATAEQGQPDQIPIHAATPKDGTDIRPSRTMTSRSA